MRDDDTPEILGASMSRLLQAVEGTGYFSTTALIDFRGNRRPSCLAGSTANITATASPRVVSGTPRNLSDLQEGQRFVYLGPLVQGMNLFASFCQDGQPQCHLITVSSKGASLTDAELKRLAVEAWCEVFGVAAPSDQELKKALADKIVEDRREEEQVRLRYLDKLRSGSGKIQDTAEKIYAKKYERVDLKGIDLGNWFANELTFRSCNFDSANFAKARITGCDMRRSTFRKVRMDGAHLEESKFDSCDFTDASFRGTSSIHGKFGNCIFHNVDFSGARLIEIDWRGADLSTANLINSYFSAKYDELTKWPANFIPTKNIHELHWKGKGPKNWP